MTKMPHKILYLALVSTLLVGCASTKNMTSESSVMPETRSVDASASDTGSKTIKITNIPTSLSEYDVAMGHVLATDLTKNANTPSPSAAERIRQAVRYIGVDGNGWATKPSPMDYSELYTRFVLISFNPATGAIDKQGGPSPALRDYRHERPDPFTRLWSAKTDTVTTLADITVRDPGMSVAIPLFSISHSSSRQIGDVWVTNFTASHVASPLFRIGPNTSLTVHLSSKVSSDVKSQGAALAVQAVTTAVSIASPASTLLTSLSKPEINNSASAVDTAISAVLSDNISEDIEFGRLMNSWQKEAAFKVAACAPFIRTEDSTATQESCSSNQDIHGVPDVAIGTWSLKVECPRVSAFDSHDICSAISSVKPSASGLIDLSSLANRNIIWSTIASSVSGAQILAFNLSSQVDIRTYVQSQSWFTTFVGLKKPTPNDFTMFCAGGVTGMESSGLNGFDSALVVRAVIDQMPQLSLAKAEILKSKNEEGCKLMLANSGVELVPQSGR